MQIEIDLDTLTGDERYHLANGLEKLETKSSSCCIAIIKLRQFNKSLETHPYIVQLADPLRKECGL